MVWLGWSLVSKGISSGKMSYFNTKKSFNIELSAQIVNYLTPVQTWIKWTLNYDDAETDEYSIKLDLGQ